MPMAPWEEEEEPEEPEKASRSLMNGQVAPPSSERAMDSGTLPLRQLLNTMTTAPLPASATAWMPELLLGSSVGLGLDQVRPPSSDVLQYMYSLRRSLKNARKRLPPSGTTAAWTRKKLSHITNSPSGSRASSLSSSTLEYWVGLFPGTWYTGRSQPLVRGSGSTRFRSKMPETLTNISGCVHMTPPSELMSLQRVAVVSMSIGLFPGWSSSCCVWKR
mmetsp:Transcript_825/g.2500  ORF Transcript_825/g.2500 Transcript_825/m.2500 type:complete len:218 (-) Transcript_825:514-1167(-)